MARDVCPWRHAYTFDNILRRLLHNPRRIFGPYVSPGMTIVDLGCGMGFTSIAMAKMVGESGRVIAVDLQPEMLEVLRKRAARAGVADRIRMHQCEADRLGVQAPVDFAVAFWMVHEVPDARDFLRQVHDCLREDARFLVAEPRFHVSRDAFDKLVATGEEVGLRPVARPRVRMSMAVVFEREAER